MVTKTEIVHKIETALKHLYINDFYLIDKDVNERSITHWIAVYLQAEFASWNVDCEYNRNVESDDLKKRLSPYGTDMTTIDDSDAKTVFPDIIIHHRGKNENLLVIEVKKRTSRTCADDFDMEKLKSYKEQLGYEYSLFLKLYDDFNVTLKNIQLT